MLLKICALFVVFVCVFVVDAVKLPSFINKCRKNDPEFSTCVLNSANAAMGQLSEGVNKIRFPSLKPLVITKADIDIGDGLNLTLTDNNIYGFETLRIDKVEANLTSRKFRFEVFTGKMSNIGKYDVNGRILILPIYGHGDINATFVNLNIVFTFDFDFYEEKGKMYMNPINEKFTYTTERAYFRLDNLFDGNEALSTQMNNFLDENWKEVNAEIGTRLGDVIGIILTRILKGFMGKVPFEDFFANEV